MQLRIKVHLFHLQYKRKKVNFNPYIYAKAMKNPKNLKLEAQGPCAGHRSTIAILHCFSLVHEKYTN